MKPIIDLIKAYAPVVIRTAAQAAAGFVGVYLLKLGVEIDDTALQGLLVGVFGGVWALLSKVLAERVHPAFAYLSISPSTPQYEQGA